MTKFEKVEKQNMQVKGVAIADIAKQTISTENVVNVRAQDLNNNLFVKCL
ncbi:hypothetical protein K0U27_10635 [archaeon]|nr:hypothetical protein [archaeon]